MKKQLLNESEIRKLMKFANIQPGITNGFVEKLNELHNMSEQEEDEDLDPMAMDAGVAEPAADEPLDEPVDAAMDEPEDPMGEPDAADTDTVLEGVKTVLEALKEGLSGMGLDEAANAITLEVTDEEDVDLADEEAADDIDLEATDEPSADEVPPPADDAGAMTASDEEEETQMVNEVLSRVVRRLRRIKKR